MRDLRNAYSNLNPSGVRAQSEKNVSIGILSSGDDFLERIRSLFGGDGSIERGSIERVTESAPAEGFHLLIAEPDYPRPKNAFVFSFRDPEQSIQEILDQRQDIEVALARTYPIFRTCVIDRIISRTAQENALFAVVTGLPNVIPNLLELPWAVGEFASDTAFLTMNQVRMAFLIAACHAKPVGYAEQKMELATIVAGAFGWRALARELAGKIPLGGGLIPKAAISYAGSYIVGIGLDRLHRTGAPLSRRERRALYGAAVEKGKQVVNQLVTTVKNRNAA
jgi:hypothetical protein